MVLDFMVLQFSLSDKSHSTFFARKPNSVRRNDLNLSGLLRLLHLRGHQLHRDLLLLRLLLIRLAVTNFLVMVQQTEVRKHQAAHVAFERYIRYGVLSQQVLIHLRYVDWVVYTFSFF